jgi:MFS family permease
VTGGRGGDTGWLVALCIARGGASVMSMAFPTVLAAVQTEWGLSNRAAGSISSASQAGTALSLVVLSAMADYWGPRAVFLVSSVVAVVVALALPVLAQGQASAVLLFFVMAVVVAGSYTPGVMLIAGRFEPGRRGGAVGWFLASSSLGYVLALAAGGWVVASAGWRAALWALALGPLVCLAVSIGLFRDRRPSVAAVAAPRFSLDTGLRGNRAGQFIVAGYVFHSWELLGMWAWTPAFMAAVLVAHGASPERSAGLGAGLAALFHVMGIVAGSTGGWLSDRWGRTAVIAWMMAVSTLCSFTFGWMLETPLLAVALLGCLYGYAALGDSPVYSTAITETVPASRLGSALAIRSLLGFGAGAISPWVFGWMLDVLGGRESSAAWGWAFSMLGIGGVLGLVTILWLRRLPEARRLAGGRR